MSKKTIIPETPSASAYASEKARGIIADVDEPIVLVEAWLAEARDAELNDSNAMALATVDAEGLPDVRMVLLKDISATGFTFYTHETSAKGQQLDANPKAALLFHWKSQRRQIRVRGRVIRGGDEAADHYFASRARISRLGAWASDQSKPLESPEALKARLEEVKARFGEEEGEVPRPERWRGFCVVPEQIEFWQDQPFRLHDRVLFVRAGEGWTKGRLHP